MNNKLDPEILAHLQLHGGDLAGLNDGQILSHINYLCEKFDLDPALTPFLVYKSGPRLQIYARKSCTEQLAVKHEISFEIRERQRDKDVFTVLTRLTLKDGRYTDSTGVVAIAGLEGESLSNSFMKCETKSKRRGVLSLLGLGVPDESEIDSIPGATTVVPKNGSTPEPQHRVEEQGKAKLAYEDEKFPFSDLKGLTLGEVMMTKGRKEIERLIGWCKRRERHLDFAGKAEAFLQDTGLNFQDTPTPTTPTH